MSYELFYDCGGHSGPYHTLEQATSTAKAKLAGMQSMQSVDIRFRDPEGIGGYGKLVMKIMKTDG